MSLRYLINFIAISGIFSKKDEELDILPPPPPFPVIGKENRGAKEARKIREQQEKQKEQEKRQKEKERKVKLRQDKRKDRGKRIFEFFHDIGLVKTEKEKKEYRIQKQKEKEQRELEKKRGGEEKRKVKEDRRKWVLEEERKRQQEEARKKRELEKKRQKVLDEERKQEEEKQRQIEEKRKEEEKRRKQEERKKAELREKEGKELELKRKTKKKRQVKEEKLQIPKKTIFGKIFGEKKEETEFAKELREIERLSSRLGKTNLEKKRGSLFDKIAPEPVKGKRAKKAKLEIPGLISLKTKEFEKKVGKPEEVIKAEEEIQKAISGMKKAKRPSIVKGLFKKKKPVEDARKPTDSSDSLSGTNYVGKIEIPEVMPRTYDKIDHVMLIEEKIHQARLALMDFKFDDAKMVYIKVMKMYNELEPKKRSKVYQDIRDLYYERKSAEKFVK